MSFDSGKNKLLFGMQFKLKHIDNSHNIRHGNTADRHCPGNREYHYFVSRVQSYNKGYFTDSNVNRIFTSQLTISKLKNLISRGGRFYLLTPPPPPLITINYYFDDRTVENE